MRKKRKPILRKGLHPTPGSGWELMTTWRGWTVYKKPAPRESAYEGATLWNGKVVWAAGERLGRTNFKLSWATRRNGRGTWLPKGSFCFTLAYEFVSVVGEEAVEVLAAIDWAETKGRSKKALSDYGRLCLKSVLEDMLR